MVLCLSMFDNKLPACCQRCSGGLSIVSWHFEMCSGTGAQGREILVAELFDDKGVQHGRFQNIPISQTCLAWKIISALDHSLSSLHLPIASSETTSSGLESAKCQST